MPHVWVAANDATAMSSNGVTATSSGAYPATVNQQFSGMVAYDTVAAAVNFAIAEENKLAGEDPAQVTISGAATSPTSASPGRSRATSARPCSSAAPGPGS